MDLRENGRKAKKNRPPQLWCYWKESTSSCGRF